MTPLPPFDFGFSSRFFAARSTLPVGPAQPDQNNRLTLYAFLDDSPHGITVRSTGQVEKPQLEYSWSALRMKGRSQNGSRAAASAVAEFLTRVFSLELDLKPFYRTLSRDRPLKPLVAQLRGLKPVLTTSVFDAAVWAIVGQQISLPFARTLKSRLAEKYGATVSTPEGEISLGPSAQRLARSRTQSLKKLQLSEQKADYLLGLSRLIDSGRLDLNRVTGMPYDEAHARLMEIRGIGEWSASYILLRGAGKLDALPLGDAGLRRAMASGYQMEAPPGRDDIIRRAAPYRPYRSLYTLYLWQGLA
ncbi:MAG: DNA-3-methyladenine glycosylase family protein [Candidatus Zixiibacteriota bacterium]